jgi:5-methylcytosine-specific restriction enzyme A
MSANPLRAVCHVFSTPSFIEAHHLRSIATLEEEVAVNYDVAADSAALCANCHRMIHRGDDPSNSRLFQASLTSNKT